MTETQEYSKITITVETSGKTITYEFPKCGETNFIVDTHYLDEELSFFSVDIPLTAQVTDVKLEFRALKSKSDVTGIFYMKKVDE